MCAFLLMMTSSSTSSEGRDTYRSDLASVDATLTLSVGASVVDVLRWANGKGAVLGADGFFLRTRFLCTLFAICCSNGQIYAGFGGSVGQLAPELCIDG